VFVQAAHIENEQKDERRKDEQKVATLIEYGDSIGHDRGTVGLAVQSGGNALFFINLTDNDRVLRPGGSTEQGFTVFGRVVNGLDVVRRIHADLAEPLSPHDTPILSSSIDYRYEPLLVPHRHQ
jgi:cyclophilin family peptidyl-prolyl cis-trans isomerase